MKKILYIITIALACFSLTGCNSCSSKQADISWADYVDAGYMEKEEYENIFFEENYPTVRNIIYTENYESYDIEAVEGHVLMYFKDGTSTSEATYIIEEHGGRIIEQMPKFDYYLIEVEVGSENSFIKKMRTNSMVEYVFLNTRNYEASVYIIDGFYEQKCFKGNHGEEVRKTFEKFSSSQYTQSIYNIDGGPSWGELFTNILCKRIQQVMESVDNDELVLINRSISMASLGRDKYCETIQYVNVGNRKQKSYAKEYFKNLTSLATCIKKIENSGKYNFILTQASGNEGVHNLDELILNKLDNQSMKVLKRHLVLVNALDLNTSIRYSNNTIRKNTISTTIDISDCDHPGTSFAAPKLLGWIDKLTTEYDCLNAQDILQIIRNTTPVNSFQPVIQSLDYFDMIREAQRLCLRKEEEKSIQTNELVGTKWKIENANACDICVAKTIWEFQIDNQVKIVNYFGMGSSEINYMYKYFYDTQVNNWKMYLTNSVNDVLKMSESEERELAYKMGNYYILTIENNTLLVMDFLGNKKEYLKIN
ncbi:putative small secreted protein [Parabacteroides sp. PF5-5]|uniref:S8 family serine peptidase n=1 Tax=unclassified Parabacteroides TaxID=2649774 RepID=UPI0024744130|nr:MULTISPECIES: hypothetical protein [unclassified Parabacteroides]MDH6303909.1 putative small secreted protein [Parabacteroides sp. PH5-39]MDH6314526.1 putative small secreted protein [Parabacteroides sp. PF5-13]MDH6318409.1 putative small secreted protein [Parabacteroides sp. PH5-13]MDH6322298.1 putative small secreted protein [Parabacteroides sp. PH5-8]MDH6325622.1 putative small secreted protein [Parabacteroides sp. PH5-41]